MYISYNTHIKKTIVSNEKATNRNLSKNSKRCWCFASDLTIVENIDLTKLSQLIASEREIHIGYSTINSMNLLDADIDVPFVIEDCRIGEINARYANIKSRMEISRSEINHIDLSEARISEKSSFNGANLDYLSLLTQLSKRM